jgi:uncharacterized membrane protein (UPF0127 family)
MFDRRRNFGRRGIVSTFFWFAWFANVVFACPAAADPLAVEPLQIVTATGVHVLRVEVARSAEEQKKGLMFRRSLPENGGMLFDFHREQEILMWMKNTYIPLDMIFVSSNGQVVSVARGTEPMSETIISSGAPAYAVIEVNAGTAKKLAVEVGNLVQHSIFHNQIME